MRILAKWIGAYGKADLIGITSDACVKGMGLDNLARAAGDEADRVLGAAHSYDSRLWRPVHAAVGAWKVGFELCVARALVQDPAGPRVQSPIILCCCRAIIMGHWRSPSSSSNILNSTEGPRLALMEALVR